MHNFKGVEPINQNTLQKLNENAQKKCNVPFPLGSQNTVVVYPISRKPLDGQAREMILVKSLLNYKVKLRKSEFINIKPLFEGISLQLLIK
jgi:hypothetical protein